MPTTRRRLQQQKENAEPVISSPFLKKAHEDSDYEDEQQVYLFDGVEYSTYQEMVDAKRKRNQQVLQGLGFLEDSRSIIAKNKAQTATQRGIKKRKTPREPVVSRKSSRLSGSKASHVALDYYVNNWNRDNSVVKVEKGDGGDEEGEDLEPETQKFFKDRVNDGSDLTLEEAIGLNESKWIKENSVDLSRAFQKELVQLESNPRIASPKSVIRNNWEKEVIEMIDDLSIDNEEWVAKVTPDRIYSVCTHPSESKLICGAGDKQGYIGLWDVDAPSSEDNHNGVHLFRVHSRPICCLEWASSDSMISASYDGSVRRLNVETGTFQEIFATYDDSDSYYAEELGYGFDEGYRYWLQNVTVDPRYKGSNPCLFASTSAGTAFHLDLRVSEKQRVTFHEELSEKKINTLSLHPNGHTLASAGLDGIVRLWDIRKFKDSHRSPRKKSLQPVASQVAGLSISSAYFSPSGNSLLTTSFANRLDLTENPHLQKGKIKPTKSIRHNNQTGRWLSTFMASWHPQSEIFVCGSMNKPRCMEIYQSDGELLRAVTGESLASVMSRCCFHPSTEKLIMVGGNSSGRVVAVR